MTDVTNDEARVAEIREFHTSCPQFGVDCYVCWLLDQRDRYKAAVDAVLGLHRPVKKGDDEWEPDTMVGRTVYCLQCSSGECGWPVRLDECPERMAVTEALGGDQ